jgi:hypothetical protein
MRIRTLPGLFAFLLAGFLLFSGLQLVLNAGMRRIRSGMFGAFNRAADGKVNAEIIVSGSSRAAMQYDPAILSRATGLSVFNLGRIGAAPNVHTGILRFYLNHNRPPRLLVENVDLFALVSVDDLFDPPQYTPYLYDRDLYKALRRRYPQIWRARYLPLYGYAAGDSSFRHYLGLQALFGIQPQEDYEDGYYPVSWTWSGKFQKLIATKKTFQFRVTPTGVTDFEEFLSEAESRGIPTILVLSPLYREYLAMESNPARIRAAFADLALLHGAEFWDMGDIPSISGDTGDFFEPDHMNRRGATAFSELLGARLAAWLSAADAPGSAVGRVKAAPLSVPRPGFFQ